MKSLLGSGYVVCARRGCGARGSTCRLGEATNQRSPRASAVICVGRDPAAAALQSADAVLGGDPQQPARSVTGRADPQAAPISAQRLHLAAGDREVADRSTGRPLAEVSAVRRVPNGAPQAAQLERRPVTELVIAMELPTIRPSVFLLVKSTRTSWLPRDCSGESEVR
jgi:hypothetical protein